MIRSFRVRLTIWNAAVIAIVLVGFAAGLIYTNQARLAADIDRELADRATHVPPAGPPRPRGPGFGQGDGRPGQGPPEGDRNDALPLRFSDPVAIRFADVRRPRRFDGDGQPIGQMRDQPFDPQAIQAAIQGRATYSNGLFDEEPIRIYTQKLDRGPNQGQIIQVARETRDLDRIWAAQLWTLAFFLPVAVLGAAGGAFFLTSRATKPIARMKQAASAISEKDLTRRLEIDGQDEFAELGVTFNAMIDRLEESFSNQKAAYASLEEAHEVQKRFTADASHELRTPLTRIRLATSSALAETATAEERLKALQVADSAAQSMGRLVQEMLVLARADAGQLSMQCENVDLRVLVADVLEGFSPSGVELIGDMQDSPVTISGDAGHLSRVVANLVENALRHTSSGSVTVAVRAVADQAVLEVRDTGEGIAPEHLPHLTERFYRADSSRARTDGGVGLGLAICKTIVEAHKGRLTFESEVGKGTCVRIGLPLMAHS